MNKAVQSIETEELDRLAYEALANGNLNLASLYFGEMIRRHPTMAVLHYDRGLAQKYLRNWSESLHHSLLSQSLREAFDEASAWNAGIAATAIRDWKEARIQWARCGIALPGEEGPIQADYGTVCIRLNAWSGSETLFANRIDPVRAQLVNIPLPESGYCFGDIVLHDGARTGQCNFRDRVIPVFNALERWQPSEFQTFTAFVTCHDPDDLALLLESEARGIGCLEDWTESLAFICLKCSYDLPHYHDEEIAETEWQANRHVGIAAQSHHAVEKILADWQRDGGRRAVDGIESRAFPVPTPADGQVWWQTPDERD